MSAPVAGKPAPAPPEPEVLSVQPLGDGLSDADLAFVRNAIRSFYGLDVDLGTPRPLPAAAYYEPRHRYRAERLIEHLAPDPRGARRFVLGLTASDISTTTRSAPDWGVIGLAQLDGSAGVVSTFRCGARVSEDGRRVRLAKVAVHEVGHILGLEHCATAGCLMHDAEGRIATVDAGHDLCPACRAHFGTTRILPAQDVLPWPRPASIVASRPSVGSAVAMMPTKRSLATSAAVSR